MSINAIKKPVNNVQKSQAVRYDTVKVNNEAVKSAALKGLLLKQHIKKQETIEDFTDFDRISTSLLIPEQVEAFKLKEQEKNKKEEFDIKKILKPALVAAGITFATVGGISVILRKYSKVMLEKPDLIQPEDLARNINIVEEPHFAMYRALRDPSAKNILGLVGVGVMSIVTTTGKNFIDGCKEAWTKKQECNINHDLQENLIAVEAQSFSGKMQIIRSMLSDKAKVFSESLQPSFKSKKEEKEVNKSNLPLLALGIGTLAGIVGLGYYSVKNIRRSEEFLKKGLENTKKGLENVINDFNNNVPIKPIENHEGKILKDKDAYKHLVENMLESIFAKPAEIDEYVSKMNLSKAEQKDFSTHLKKSMNQATEKVNSAIGGSGRNKITYFSHVNDYLSFFYDWLMNPKNPQFKNLFFGITGVSALAYCGKTASEAVKDVQVKKNYARVELDLQKRLVATELRNFNAKKESAIEPLCEEFFEQKRNGKSPEELKVMADNILFEIKNGPPFVYS